LDLTFHFLYDFIQIHQKWTSLWCPQFAYYRRQFSWLYNRWSYRHDMHFCPWFFPQYMIKHNKTILEVVALWHPLYEIDSTSTFMHEHLQQIDLFLPLSQEYTILDISHFGTSLHVRSPINLATTFVVALKRRYHITYIRWTNELELIYNIL